MSCRITGKTAAPAHYPNVQTLGKLLATDALIVSYAGGPGTQNRYWTAAYQFQILEVQPADVQIDVLDIEGLPKEVFNVSPITEAVLGAFRVNFSWKLPWRGAYKPKP